MPASASVATVFFQFRELIRPEELLDYFRLRHLVYCREGYLEPRPHQVDIDPFDGHSRFVGAFLLSPDQPQGRMVAGARMILPAAQPHQATLAELTERGLLPSVPQRDRIYNFHDIFDLKSVFHYCQSRDQTLVEFGRAVVDPEWRSTGLGLKLIHALHGLALHHSVELGFAAIPPKLRGFYEKSGCRILDSKGTSSLPGIDSDLLALVIDLTRLSGVMRAAYRAHKHLSRYGSWQVCGHAGCLEEHRHLPGEAVSESLWRQIQPVVERLPAVEVHGWEPAMARLPLLRGDLQLMDQTLGDGLMSASVDRPRVESCLALLTHLEALGITGVHLGAPSLSAAIAQETSTLVSQASGLSLELTCAAGTGPGEVAAVAAMAQRAGRRLAVALAPGRLTQAELPELLERTLQGVRQATGEGLPVTVVAEDAARTPPHILEALFHTALGVGAGALCLRDTVGQATPHGTAQLVSFASAFLRRHGYQARLEWHGRNDRGLGVANALAAVEAGAERIHASVLGVGERVGNAALERLLIQLHRLSGRPLNLEALRLCLEWGRRHLGLSWPGEFGGLFLKEKAEVTHATVRA